MIQINKIILSELLTIISITVALVLGCIGIIRDCAQDDKLSELTYLANASQYRPIIKVIGEPRIISYQIDQGKMAVKDIITPDSSGVIRDVPAKIKLDLKFTMVNKGTALARIYAYVFGDTTTGIDHIRQIIKNGDTSRINIAEDSSFFNLTELPIGDTTQFEVSHWIKYVNTNSFTIHLFVLYANEMNVLFDSYYWARYNLSELITTPEFRIQNGTLQFRFVAVKGSFKDFIRLIDANQSTNVYSKDYGDKIIKYFESIKK